MKVQAIGTADFISSLITCFSFSASIGNLVVINDGDLMEISANGLSESSDALQIIIIIIRIIIKMSHLFGKLK
jgi:hypothetical protein